MAKYHIAVCDDSAQDAAYVEKMLNRWATARKVALRTEIFPSAESFLFRYEEEKDFAILLLDIEMGRMDGVTMAKKLREKNDSVQIVFITGYADYIAEGYEVAALHYLMKPVREEKLFEVLDRAAANLEKPKRAVLLSAEGELIRLPAEQVVYAEAFSHSLSVVTESKSYDVRKPLSEMEQELGEGFVRCHRSYLVNVRYIARISRTEIVLDDGKTLPVSRRAAQAVHEAFVTYYKGQLL